MTDVLRIAQVAPLYEAVPPAGYGGTERVIAALCDGLVERGHDVTLFAAESSATAARREAYGPPLRTRMSRQELLDVAPHLHLQLLEEVYRRADEFQGYLGARRSPGDHLVFVGRISTEAAIAEGWPA